MSIECALIVALHHLKMFTISNKRTLQTGYHKQTLKVHGQSIKKENYRHWARILEVFFRISVFFSITNSDYLKTVPSGCL